MPTTKKKLVKKKVGRPKAITEEVVSKLESVFKLGVTDEVACNYASIPEPTYYTNLKKDKGFHTKMRAAQNFARIVAGQVVVKAITENEDVQSAKWWLEKKHSNEFGGQPAMLQQVNIKFDEGLPKRYMASPSRATN